MFFECLVKVVGAFFKGGRWLTCMSSSRFWTEAHSFGALDFWTIARVTPGLELRID